MIIYPFRPAGLWLCGLLLCGPAAASEYTSPEAIDGAVTIDAEQLIELVGGRADMVLIDSRIREDHTDGHIEGSKHLVDRETNCKSLARVLSGKRAPVVFYCNGVNCDRSDKAIVIALDCGYREIYWFRGGIEEWRARKYPLTQ